MADVFVSYSRHDAAFVRRLVASIEDRGKQVWLDTEGIADAEVFPAAIKRAIEQSDAFLFVITPAAVDSAYCENEVEYAREMQKRIVPVLREAVPDERLHSEIRDRNWIPFTDDAEFDPSMGRLVRALDADLEAARAHTRWLVKALEWEAEGRDKSFLLRGAELKSAEGWLAASPEDADPAPTQLQREYVLASRDAANRRQRLLVGASLAVAVVSIGLLIFALISRGQAVSERVASRAQALAAESQAQLPNDPEISLILGMRGVLAQATPQTMFALRAALDASPLQLALPSVASPGSCGPNGGLAAAFSPNGRQIVETACDGTLRLIDASTGRITRAANLRLPLSAVAYSPDGSLMAVGTPTGVMLLDPATGAVKARLTASPSPAPTAAIAFSPNGRLLAADDPKGITLWSLRAMRPRAFERDIDEGGTMVFSRDGRQLIVGGANTDNSVHIYDVASGRMVRRIVATGNQGPGWPEVVALSPDGSRLAVGYPADPSNSTAKVSVYSMRSWAKEFDVMAINLVEISSVAFSPDGTRLAIGAEDGTAGVWALATREQVATYDGSTAAVGAMSFAPDGQSILSASNDGVARVWRAQGVEQSSLFLAGNAAGVALTPHQLTIVEGVHGGNALHLYTMPGGKLVSTWMLPRALQAPTLSPDGRLLATLPGGPANAPPPSSTSVSGPPKGPVRVWSVATHKQVAVLYPTQGAATGLAISPDDRFAVVQEGASPSAPGTPVVVNIATGSTATPRGANRLPCLSANSQDYALSRNDRVIAIAGFCGEVGIWNATTGRQIRTLNQGAEISAVDLAPDGSRVLVTSWDSRATIYDVATGRPLVNLVGHTRGIAWGGFAAGGSEVLTESLDHTVRVWNAHTGQQLRVLTFTNDQGGPVAFSPDGLEVAIPEIPPQPGAENVVRVFDTCPACQNPRALLGLARPHAAPANRLTVLERTVVNGA
jgi:WD40 repeat protein